MTDNQQRAAELVPDSVPAYYRGPATEAIAAALDEAEARGRAEGYHAAVEESRKFCARSGGCI